MGGVQSVVSEAVAAVVDTADVVGKVVIGTREGVGKAVVAAAADASAAVEHGLKEVEVKAQEIKDDASKEFDNVSKNITEGAEHVGNSIGDLFYPDNPKRCARAQQLKDDIDSMKAELDTITADINKSLAELAPGLARMLKEQGLSTLSDLEAKIDSSLPPEASQQWKDLTKHLSRDVSIEKLILTVTAAATAGTAIEVVGAVMAMIAVAVAIMAIIDASKEREEYGKIIAKLAFARVDARQTLEQARLYQTFVGTLRLYLKKPAIATFDEWTNGKFNQRILELSRSRIISDLSLLDTDREGGSWTQEDPDVTVLPPSVTQSAPEAVAAATKDTTQAVDPHAAVSDSLTASAVVAQTSAQDPLATVRGVTEDSPLAVDAVDTIGETADNSTTFPQTAIKTVTLGLDRNRAVKASSKRMLTRGHDNQNGERHVDGAGHSPQGRGNDTRDHSQPQTDQGGRGRSGSRHRDGTQQRARDDGPRGAYHRQIQHRHSRRPDFRKTIMQLIHSANKPGDKIPPRDFRVLKQESRTDCVVIDVHTNDEWHVHANYTEPLPEHVDLKDAPFTFTNVKTQEQLQDCQILLLGHFTRAPRPSGRPSRQQLRQQVKSRKPTHLSELEPARSEPLSSISGVDTLDSTTTTTFPTLPTHTEKPSTGFDTFGSSIFTNLPLESLAFGDTFLAIDKEHPTSSSYGTGLDFQPEISMLELDFSAGSLSEVWLKKGIQPHIFMNRDKSYHLKKLAALNSVLLQHLAVIDKLVYGDCCGNSPLMERTLPAQHSSLHSHHPESNLDIKAILGALQEFTSIVGSFLMFTPITTAPRLTPYLDTSEEDAKSDCSDIEFDKRSLPEGTSDTGHCWTDHDLPSATEQTSRGDTSSGGPLIDYPTILALTTCYVSLVRLLRMAFYRILSCLEALSEHDAVPSYKSLPPLIPNLDLGGFSFSMHRSMQISVFMHVALDLLWRAEKGITAVAAAERTGASTTSSGHMELLKTMLKQEAATAERLIHTSKSGAIGRQSLKSLAGRIRDLCRGHVCLQLEETTFQVDTTGATFDAGMELAG
ncbi:hypothetical protein LTR84_000462 [Exophiala bonariae]|uniref:Uncharacterized protein n=1 Tax=Exophiala bonariae TaxID=1690606 RepID=A0AAV9NUB9_9EURO|nr:hypothetical protein LTR84_000462 [Exophiala bonariae]